jgi:FkbM family methyltransferase
MSSPQPHPDRAFSAALSRLGPRAVTVVDVGARWLDTTPPWFRLDPLVHVIGFEPDPTECERLAAQADPAAHRFVPVALGREPGTTTLHVTREPACSSLYPPSGWMRARYPSLHTLMELTGTATVPLTTLDRWAADAGVSAVDLVKLDTQGAELDVLAGGEQLLRTCLGVEVEVMFAPLYDGQPLFADVDAFLRRLGFGLWRLDELAHYAERPTPRLTRGPHFGHLAYDNNHVWHPTGDGRLVWANAVYFRDRDQFTADARSLLVLATLLEAVGDRPASEACLTAATGVDPTITFAPLDVMPDDTSTAPEPTYHDPAGYLAPLPFEQHLKDRVVMTVGCHDCDPIPKVPGAGGTFATPDGIRYQRMHNGVKVIEDGYCGRWMTELIRLGRGHHEPQEEWAFHEVTKYLPDRATMLELGSNWAYYSLWFAYVVRHPRLLMVEPDAANLDTGRRNFTLNGRTGEFLRASVGRTSTPPKPFVTETDPNPQLLPEVCVDDLLRRYDVPKLDLLFADIQGAELAMLQGAERSLAAGKVRFLFVSTHHHCISGTPAIHHTCLEFVRKHGGHVLVEHGVVESYSGDGLIVASFDPADRTLPPIHVSRNHPSNSLFRDLELDLWEAWHAIADIGEALRDPKLAAKWNELRSRHPLLAARWPHLG